MNTITIPRSDDSSGLRRLLQYLITALCSTTRLEAGYFLLIALLAAGINAISSLEFLMKGMEAKMLVAGVLLPLIAYPFCLAGWVLSDRWAPDSTGRRWHLAVGALAGASVYALLAPLVLGLVGLPFNPKVRLDGGQLVEIPAVIMQVSIWLEAALYSAVSYAVLEAARRRDRTRAAVDDARREQASMARELLESRLAAMQAQVEPQFLFDTLVDVQATYDRDAAGGADVMDRLINYLRVALPRLRESGSTVQAEVDLVEAYLAVVSARHGGLPRVMLTLDQRASTARFYPMLLLPLVQRAVRLGQARGAVPQRVQLHVDARGAQLIAQLRIDAPDLCADDPELARVRERLAGLYDGHARLDCATPSTGLSQFTLTVPL